MACKGPGERDRAPALSGEERELWRRVTREAKPLKGRERPARPAIPVAPSQGQGAPPGAPPSASAPGAKVAPPEPAPSLAGGVDRRTAERLRRGQLPVEARLDLHGHTQAAAAAELGAFLAGAQAAGKRCVLVITGTGATKEGGGVLRAQVPRWLELPPNRARVLALAPARPRDGGAGALYVLLRKRRA